MFYVQIDASERVPYGGGYSVEKTDGLYCAKAYWHFRKIRVVMIDMAEPFFDKKCRNSPFFVTNLVL